MAFQRRLLNTLPTRTPDVEIIFHGQILLQSRDGIICDVGINPLATNHTLTIEARTKVQGQPDVVQMRHLGPLPFRGGEGMTIEVSGQVDVAAAWNCVDTVAPNYELGTGAVAEDFRWILNLEGHDFHAKKLDCPLFRTQHAIKLQNGEYFFRTGGRAGAGLRHVRSRGGGSQKFRRIGAIARASVFLQPTQGIVLRWNNGDPEIPLTLPKPPANGIHEIYIENTPLFVPQGSGLGHDELAEYYKVITNVPYNEKFTFKSEIDVAVNEFGTPTIPCQVVRVDEPGN